LSGRSRWTLSELERVLAAAHLGPEGIQAACPDRSPTALASLIADIHRIHQGRRPRSVSRLIQRHIAATRGALRCPRCGAIF